MICTVMQSLNTDFVNDKCAEGTDSCDQNCTCNINGGFNCSCLFGGYVLHMDEATCTGQWIAHSCC